MSFDNWWLEQESWAKALLIDDSQVHIMKLFARAAWNKQQEKIDEVTSVRYALYT